MNKVSICKVLVLKVASLCNLNCTYCYMYNLGDETFKNQPKFMSNETVDSIIENVRNHCKKHDLSTFEFIFHGGEPMLISMDFYRNFVQKANHKILATKIFYSIQTNGTLITKPWCELLNDLDIGLGISLDGYEEINDKYRVTHHGKGTFQATMKGFNIASKFSNFSGVLSVINIQSNPQKIYDFLKEHKIKYADFLLPDCSYEKLPMGYEEGINQKILYADWLIVLFDQWFFDDKTRPKIRFFEQLVKIIIGLDEGFEYIGQQKSEFLIIETDGSIEVTGAFKVCGDGFTKKGFNINTHSLENALEDELTQRYIHGHENLCAKCQECPIVEVCGGGFVAHRYSQSNAFDNPSVYCLDLMKLIAHIQNKVLDYLPQKLVNDYQLEYLNYEELVSL
jgi:uncharacterized protein